MSFKPFQELHVFQLAEKLADEIWDIVATWEYFEKSTMGKQLTEAADSIGANIAEGSGRGSPKDNQRFVKIARGSMNETKFWLRRAYRRNLFTQEQIDSLKQILDELGPCLNLYLKSIGKSKNPEVQHPNTQTLISFLFQSFS
jgi:four helix bundle protein